MVGVRDSIELPGAPGYILPIGATDRMRLSVPWRPSGRVRARRAEAKAEAVSGLQEAPLWRLLCV